uniref:Uncharacterized protein n=1 Tax=Anguilla anguilla TaxID=7936 RepID=A0A0E9WV71_ANGAN
MQPVHITPTYSLFPTNSHLFQNSPVNSCIFPWKVRDSPTQITSSITDISNRHLQTTIDSSTEDLRHRAQQ